MIVAKGCFEHEVKGRKGLFIIDNDCPFEIAKEILFQFSKAVGQLEDNWKAQQEAIKAQKNENKKEELPVTDIARVEEA